MACIRLGDYKHAKQLYSDWAITKYDFWDGQKVLPQDLPGTSSPKTLEASILLARGLYVYFEAPEQEALENFQQALQLAPNNALTAYYAATVLKEKHRYPEALALFEMAALGRGLIRKRAHENIESVTYRIQYAKTHH